jgi:hypothetical protein
MMPRSPHKWHVQVRRLPLASFEIFAGCFGGSGFLLLLFLLAVLLLGAWVEGVNWVVAIVVV